MFPRRPMALARASERWESLRARQPVWESAGHWPDFRPLFPFPAAPGVIPPSSPFVSIAPNAGRLPRIFQWSVGFQREVTRDLVVEASYVGNRSAWFVAPLLAA